MGKYMRGVVAVAVALWGLSLAATSYGDAYQIDFDSIMNTVWTQSAIWPVVQMYNVLPADFTLDPTKCDVNGGMDISVTPIVLFPNSILDSDEFALIAAILANPNFNCTATGGTSHKVVHDAWNRNYAQTYHDLGGGVGGPERLVGTNSMIPKIDYLFAGMMTIGDIDTLAFPMLLMDLVVNDETVRTIVNDPNVVVPDESNYTILYPYLGWCGDADGDGYSNLEEYLYYFPRGGRSVYIAAALGPTTHPPDPPSGMICNGNGGLLGEYFNTRNLSGLTATRLDHEISFDWGRGKPHTLINADNFSIIWTGYVIPQYNETYTFSVRTDDGVRLWVNDELLVDKWTDHGATTYSGTTAAPLEAGQQYPIRMDFYEGGGDAVAWLGWESASQERKAIYEMYLKPGTGVGDCSNDWFFNPANQHFYKLTPVMTWTQGHDLARTPAYNAYLATINNADENQWVYLTFGKFAGQFFLGGNDGDTEGQWVWDENGANFFNGTYSAGSVVSPWFANWNSAEPNDAGGNENALVMINGSGLWNDLDVNHALPCLVESGTGHVNITGPLPSNVTLFPGDHYELTIQVRHPVGTPTFQWRLNGANIPGATTDRLVIQNASDVDAGDYTCMAGDQSTSDESGASHVTVLPDSAVPAQSLAAVMVLTLMLALLLVRYARIK